MRIISGLFSALLAISFFLPWMDISIFHASGYDLPSLFQQAAVRGDSFVWIGYGLYLIPIFAIFHTICLFIGKYSRGFGLITAALPIIYLLYFIRNLTVSNSISGTFTDILQMGAYLTIVSAIMLFITTVGYLPENRRKRVYYYK